jgi:hypothetical protein
MVVSETASHRSQKGHLGRKCHWWVEGYQDIRSKMLSVPEPGCQRRKGARLRCACMYVIEQFSSEMLKSGLVLFRETKSEMILATGCEIQVRIQSE